jgi:hypothetical protein
MLRQPNGEPVRLQKPNPIMVNLSPRSSWEGGEEENFHDLGQIYVERGKSDHAPDIETFINMEEREDTPRITKLPDGDLFEDEEMLRNKDGSPYKLNGSVNNYDPSNPDHDLMDSVDKEQIESSGAPIEYYRVIVDSNVDQLYHEQRQKVYLQEPILMKAVWEPVSPIWNDISVGFSSEESMVFSFNRKEFIEKVGEMPRIGSIIKTCDEGMFWEIVNRNVNVENEDRKMWGKHRINAVCVKYQATVTDRSPSRQGREEYDKGAKPINIR